MRPRRRRWAWRLRKVYDGVGCGLLDRRRPLEDDLLATGRGGRFAFTGRWSRLTNVGSGKTVTASGINLTSNPNNYVLASTTASAALGVITPATLTASLTGTAAKVYDGTTVATLSAPNYVLSGAIGADVVTLNDPTIGSYASKNVGSSILVTASGLALGGAAAGNYALAATSASANIGVITPATLTASLTGTVAKVYDGTTVATLSAPNYVLSGAIGADVVTLNDPTIGSYASKNVGSGILVTASGLALGSGGGELRSRRDWAPRPISALSRRRR